VAPFLVEDVLSSRVDQPMESLTQWVPQPRLCVAGQSNGFLIRTFLTDRRSVTCGFLFSDLDFPLTLGRDVIGSREFVAP
jgi:hypothetical protein